MNDTRKENETGEYQKQLQIKGMFHSNLDTNLTVKIGVLFF